MILRRKLKIPPIITISTRAVIILSLTLILTYSSFVNLPNSFAQTTTGINQTTSSLTSTATPPPPSFRPFPPPSVELSASQISASTNKTCTLIPSSMKLQGTPQQTEGPYFVDGMPNRSDIRSDPSDGSVQQGIPLRLVVHI